MVVGVEAAVVVHEAAVVVVAVHHGRAPPAERGTLLRVAEVDPDEVVPDARGTQSKLRSCSSILKGVR